MTDEMNRTGNDIDGAGKFWGGALLILFTASASLCLIAFWPDKLPDINATGSVKYSFGWFSVRMKDDGGMDLNTLYLILVALAGFLGNMIHVGTSFTTFVGNENFKKSWLLWYCVKPFTAAALALIIYFIIRAGFLSYGADAKNVSLYGILSLAALAGLFTDIATLKLKEVFETIFKPRDDRDDKLSAFKIDNIVPQTLKKGPNDLSLKGKGFDKNKLVLKIGGQEIQPTVVNPESIDFSYKVEDTVASGTKLSFSVLDDAEKELYKHSLTVE